MADVQTTMFAKQANGMSRTEALSVDLARRVVAGEWAVGSLLTSEPALSREYQLSRPSVREALQRLLAAGLISTRHGLGSAVQAAENWQLLDPLVLRAYVESGRVADIAGELLELRTTVEVRAAGLAAVRISAQQRRALRDWWDRLEATLTEPDAFAAADVAFHDVIMRATGNRFLRGIAVYLAEPLNAARRMTAHSGGLEGCTRAQQAHQKILRAIEVGDAGAARATMSEHMQQTESDVKQALLRWKVETP